MSPDKTPRRGSALSVLLVAMSSITNTFAADDWDSFWRSVKVSPAPSRDFLEGQDDVVVRNLTVGRLSDDTAKAWVLADLRRSRGDNYSLYNLRRDIADAGIFGPPGLNGTSEEIDRLRGQGIEKFTGDLSIDVVTAAVVWVSPQQRREHPDIGLTEYVIVLLYRMPPGRRAKQYADGRSEPFALADAIQLRWQLDSGHFFEHPALGPLWYQHRGWTCVPHDGTLTGEICGRLRP